MAELFHSGSTSVWLILLVTTVVTLAGFAHLLWMWRKISRSTRADEPAVTEKSEKE